MRLSQSGNALIKKTASLVISAMACTLAFGLLPSPSVATTTEASNDLRNKASNDIAVSLNGKFTQGALLRGQAPVESKVFLNGIIPNSFNPVILTSPPQCSGVPIS